MEFNICYTICYIPQARIKPFLVYGFQWNCNYSWSLLKQLISARDLCERILLVCAGGNRTGSFGGHQSGREPALRRRPGGGGRSGGYRRYHHATGQERIIHKFSINCRIVILRLNCMFAFYLLTNMCDVIRKMYQLKRFIR